MKKLQSINPHDYRLLGEVAVSTESDIQEAVARARQAQTEWARLSVNDRCKSLASFVAIAEKQKERIARLMTQEVGRQINSSRDNVEGGITYFRAYMEMAEQYLAPVVTYETDQEIHRMYREPWGVIAAICPWNYPFQNVAWQCGQALIAGNTIVYKSSEENPLFAMLIEELIGQSNLPKGVFNVLYGDGETGRMMLNQPIDMISFTGSSATGQKLAKIAAEKFIPIVAELGGSAPAIIFEDADIDDIVGYVCDRRFKLCGQSCDALKRVIVHESKCDELVDKLQAVIAGKKVGDPLDELTDVGPLVAKRQVELIESQVKDAIEKGAEVRIGGSRPKDLLGAYYLPTLLTHVTRDMRVWKEETFGPVLPVVSFSTEEEAILLANDSDYGLNAHIMTHNKERFERVAKQIQAGMVAQNKIRYGNPQNPFGGYKKSGIGRIHSGPGFDEVTQIKVVSEEK